MVVGVVVWGDPDMLRRRGGREEDAQTWDQLLITAGAGLFWFAPMVVAGLDHGRFHWSPPLPAWAEGLALLLVALGFALGTWAMVTNRFFTKFVQVRSDGTHRVVSTGPYAHVRHPGYTGGLLSFAALPVALGSLVALAPALAGLILLVLRTHLEDRFLRRELPGYADYARRVPWRLVPGLW